MSKHTPGPWYLLSGNGDYNISTTTGPDWSRDNNFVGIFSGSEANAHLIAAAPDLLEAARWLLDELEHQQNQPGDPVDNRGLSAAQAAIAKATGENNE